VAVEELWSRALDDAGIEPSHVQRIGFDRPMGPKRLALHIPPGGMPGGTFELSRAERAVVAKSSGGHRVLHVTDGEEPGLLGVLRAQLEHVRQFDAQRGSYQLSSAINASLDELYSGRLGGAIVYLAMPMMRDGTAAGGRLIRKVFGPQPGKFYDPVFGPLYRTDKEPGDLESLPMRTVVFAAIHAEAFERWASVREMGQQLLADAHPDAPTWWEALKADDLFVHLSKSAPAYNPDQDDIDAFGEGQAAQAWRPLEALLDRTVELGTNVLTR
jgi:hypothetical protein